MLILAIDNSLDALNIVVYDGALAKASETVTGGPSPSEIISGITSEVLAQGGYSIKDMGSVAVTLGPGSFTGVRVSLAFAKGICAATGLPLIGIPTLDLLAYPFSDREGAFICPLIDAKKGEVFTALYQVSQGTIHRLTEYGALKPQALPGFIRKPCICFGTGLAVTETILSGIEGVTVEKDENRCRISIEAMGDLTNILSAGKTTGSVTHPIYGRKSEAEIKFNITVT